MTKPHGISIIGLGIMGRRLLSNLQIHPAFEVTGMWDPSEDACRLAKEEAPDVPLVPSAEAAIASGGSVYLACPPDPRSDYARRAAALGKGLFLEKPLGVDVAGSRALVSELESAVVPAAVNFTQASGAALAEVLRGVETGETGPVEGIDIVVTYPNWPRAWQVEADWLRFRAEGGYTREVISHFLFFAARIIGPLNLIWSKPSYPGDPDLCETHILARLENEAGVPVTVMGSVGGAQPDRQEVTIKGESKSYRVAEFFMLSASSGGPFEEALPPPDDPRRAALQGQLTEFAKCLDGRPHRLATLREALAVQESIEAILAG